MPEFENNLTKSGCGWRVNFLTIEGWEDKGRESVSCQPGEVFLGWCGFLVLGVECAFLFCNFFFGGLVLALLFGCFGGLCVWCFVFFFLAFCFSHFESMNSFFHVLKRGRSWSLLPLNSVLECTFESWSVSLDKYLFPLIHYIVWKINNFLCGNIQAVLRVVSVQTGFPVYQEISVV